MCHHYDIFHHIKTRSESMCKILTIVFLIFIAAAGFTSDCRAKPKHQFKIASLAPEGSVWVNVFEEFAAEVAEKSAGQIVFRHYPGGVMGDDRAMYRKMRIGQLQGGGFAVTGIAEIVPDFRVMSIPFMFDSYEEIDAAVTRLIPLFTKRFADQGLVLIALTEVGFIYTFATQPRVTIAELRQGKTWAPSNDPLSSTFLESLKISPIPLSIPDVLSSLQTGLVDTVFNSLYGSIVLQWFTKASYVTDAPYGYAYGAFLLDGRAFNKLSPEQKTVVEEAAARHFGELLVKTRQSNRESRDVLVQNGVTFVPTTPETLATLQTHRDEMLTQVIGSAFSQEAYDTLIDALNAHRTP
jgi:TRAP-type C4-dicarboxylate transport system substrate-binding protein